MPPPAEPGGIALDACCVLNLAGAGVDAGDVADALGRVLLVVEQVVAEVLWIEDLDDGKTVRLPVDFGSPGFAALARASLFGSEVDVYVTLARELDDGEAATLAVAQARRLAVLTDDRKARHVAQALSLETLGTAEILRQVSAHLRLTPEHQASMLQRVERRSRFRPRASDAGAAWWEHARH